VALVGSGEYLPVMADTEALLLRGRPPRYVQLPTAAGPEGAASIRYWVDLGAEQATRLGVEAVPVLAIDGRSADDESNADLIRGAGLVYLSGGSPAYVAETLRDSRVWRRILEEWQGGAALAGCSAGAMALAGWVPDIRRPDETGRPGLGVIPGLTVLPHFDRFVSWQPDAVASVARRAARAGPGATVIGIDEETAIISDGADLSRWVVHGRRAAWLFSDGQPVPYGAGQELVLSSPVGGEEESGP